MSFSYHLHSSYCRQYLISQLVYILTRATRSAQTFFLCLLSNFYAGVHFLYCITNTLQPLPSASVHNHSGAVVFFFPDASFRFPIAPDLAGYK